MKMLFSVDKNVQGASLHSCCPCDNCTSHEGTQENTPENNENVEVILEEPIVHFSVTDLAENVKNIDPP